MDNSNTNLDSLRDNVLQLKILKNSFEKRIVEVERNIKKLEENLKKESVKTYSQKFAPQFESEPKPAQIVQPTQPTQQSQPAQPIQVTQPKPISREPVYQKVEKKEQSDFNSEINFGQKYILFAGIAIIVLSMVYFLKYSFDKGWFPPSLRVAISYLLALGFLYVGNYFYTRKSLNYGLFLIGGSSALFYGSTFFAYSFYNLIDSLTAFILMIIITVFTVCLSIKYDNKFLAIAGFTGGYITPFMVNTGQDSYIALFFYMTFLNIGITYVSNRQDWKKLYGFGVIASWLIFGIWSGYSYRIEKFIPALFYINISFIIYSIIPYIILIKQKSDKYPMMLNILNSFMAVMFNVAFIYDKTDATEYAGIVTLIYAAIYGYIAYDLDKNRNQSLAMQYVTTWSLFFSFLSIFLIFSKNFLTFFMFLSAAAVARLTKYNKLSSLKAVCIAMFGIATAKLVLYDFYVHYGYNVNLFKFRESYINTLDVRFFVVAAGILVSYYCSKVISEEKIFFNVIGIGGALLYVNVELYAFFMHYHPAGASGSLTFLYTLYGYLFIFKGFDMKNAQIRQMGLFLLGLVVLKLIFIDINALSTIARIITFFLVGILFIITSYLYYNKKAENCCENMEKK